MICWLLFEQYFRYIHESNKLQTINNLDKRWPCAANAPVKWYSQIGENPQTRLNWLVRDQQRPVIAICTTVGVTCIWAYRFEWKSNSSRATSGQIFRRKITPEHRTIIYLHTRGSLIFMFLQYVVGAIQLALLQWGHVIFQQLINHLYYIKKYIDDAIMTSFIILFIL